MPSLDNYYTLRVLNQNEVDFVLRTFESNPNPVSRNREKNWASRHGVPYSALRSRLDTLRECPIFIVDKHRIICRSQLSSLATKRTSQIINLSSCSVENFLRTQGDAWYTLRVLNQNEVDFVLRTFESNPNPVSRNREAVWAAHHGVPYSALRSRLDTLRECPIFIVEKHCRPKYGLSLASRSQKTNMNPKLCEYPVGEAENSPGSFPQVAQPCGPVLSLPLQKESAGKEGTCARARALAYAAPERLAVDILAQRAAHGASACVSLVLLAQAASVAPQWSKCMCVGTRPLPFDFRLYAERFRGLPVPVLADCIAGLEELRSGVIPYAEGAATSLLRSVRFNGAAEVRDARMAALLHFRWHSLAVWQRYYPLEVILGAVQLLHRLPELHGVGVRCAVETASGMPPQRPTSTPTTRTASALDCAYSYPTQRMEQVMNWVMAHDDAYGEWASIPWLIRCDVLMTYPKMPPASQLQVMKQLSRGTGGQRLHPCESSSSSPVSPESWWSCSFPPAVPLHRILCDAVPPAILQSTTGASRTGGPRRPPSIEMLQYNYRVLRDALEKHKKDGALRVLRGPSGYDQIKPYYAAQWRVHEGVTGASPSF